MKFWSEMTSPWQNCNIIYNFITINPEPWHFINFQKPWFVKSSTEEKKSLRELKYNFLYFLCFGLNYPTNVYLFEDLCPQPVGFSHQPLLFFLLLLGHLREFVVNPASTDWEWWTHNDMKTAFVYGKRKKSITLAKHHK